MALVGAALVALFLGAGVVQSYLRPEAATLPVYGGGYRIDRIQYQIDPLKPTRLSAVSFRFTPMTAIKGQFVIRAKTLSSSSTYVTCRQETAQPERWICPMSGMIVRSIDQLSISVDQSSPSDNRIYLAFVRW